MHQRHVIFLTAAAFVLVSGLHCTGNSGGPVGQSNAADAGPIGGASGSNSTALGGTAAGGLPNVGGTTNGAGSPPANPCIDAGTCPTGVWMDVTPKNVDLVNDLSCGNYGTQTLQSDAMHPSHFYSMFNCQGIWKSTDYGTTWTGPINTGTNGAVLGDCAGGISVPPNSSSAVPTLYAACIRGAGLGFWRSTNGWLS